MLNKNIKKKKLGSYPVAGGDDTLLVPAVIPDTKENVYFDKSDIAPIYTAGENITIENGIVSKRDTKYESGDDIITVTENNNVQTISAKDVAESSYVADTAVNITPIETNKSRIGLDGLAGNQPTPTWQKNQPTYRSGNITEYAGFSNKPCIIRDVFWSPDTPDNYTSITRIKTEDAGNGYMVCWDGNAPDDAPKVEHFDRDIKLCNQFFIHQHKLDRFYFDYNFFKTHLYKEIYITKSNTENNGCKIFFTAGTDRPLKVILYTAGIICNGETTETNNELSLMDICQTVWNNSSVSDFNYIRKPSNDTTVGYIGKSITIPAMGLYYKSNQPWYENPDGTGPVCRTLYDPVLSLPIPTIRDRYDTFYNKKDSKYNDWQYNASIIVADYARAFETEIHRGTLYRPPGYYPVSYDEYFSSLKFIVLQCIDGGWEEDDILYDLIMLADTRF